MDRSYGRYGFPNFEKIFGERPIEHGVEEPEQPVEQSQAAGAAPAQPDTPAGAKASDGEETEEVVMSVRSEELE